MCFLSLVWLQQNAVHVQWTDLCAFCWARNILTPMPFSFGFYVRGACMVHCFLILYFENREHAPLCQDNTFKLRCCCCCWCCFSLHSPFSHFIVSVLFTPFRAEAIVLFFYHSFSLMWLRRLMRSCACADFFSDWTHAFDYNFLKRYSSRSSDIILGVIWYRRSEWERAK